MFGSKSGLMALSAINLYSSLSKGLYHGINGATKTPIEDKKKANRLKKKTAKMSKRAQRKK